MNVVKAINLQVLKYEEPYKNQKFFDALVELMPEKNSANSGGKWVTPVVATVAAVSIATSVGLFAANAIKNVDTADSAGGSTYLSSAAGGSASYTEDSGVFSDCTVEEINGEFSSPLFVAPISGVFRAKKCFYENDLRYYVMEYENGSDKIALYVYRYDEPVWEGGVNSGKVLLNGVEINFVENVELSGGVAVRKTTGYFTVEGVRVRFEHKTTDVETEHPAIGRIAEVMAK